MTDLCDMSLVDAAAAIRSGAVSSEALTRACLERIAATQPTLATMITVAGEAALSQARAQDRARSSGAALGPLHGIPIAVKDVIDVAGMATTAHSRRLPAVPASRDAACISRLRQAGAVIIGKAATHEFAFGGPSLDLPFPPARNPWNPDHIPGGSSSGSAALVSAGLCPGALGTDTSGSIRMPAANCGVVGFKPTFGRVSCAGVYPLAFTMDHVGSLARTVGDAALIVDAMREGPVHRAADKPLEADLSGIVIGVPRDWFAPYADAESLARTDSALTMLADLGARVIDVDAPPLEDLNAVGRILLLAEGYAIHAAGLRNAPEDFGRLMRDRLRLGAFIGSEHYLSAQRLRRDLLIRMQAVMRQCDVIVTPAQFSPAASFAEAVEDTYPFLRAPFITIPFDVTGAPALSVPCGLTKTGLPLGLQMAARHDDERTLIRVASAFERARGPFPSPA